MPFKKFPKFLVFALLALITTHTFVWTALAQEEPDSYVSIRLLPEKTAVKGGDVITVGIEHTLYPGWHTYWKNPGDSGTKARITWSGLDGLKASDIEWPSPKKLSMGPLTNFGYEDKVVLLQDLTLPDTLPKGQQQITAVVDVLVCHEICIPETHTASFYINGDQYPAKEAVEAARAFMPLDTGWATSLSEEGKELIVTINTDTPSAFTNLKSIDLYPEEWGLIDNTTKTSAALKGDVLTLRHARGERPLSDAPVSKLVITYNDALGKKAAVRVSTLLDSAAVGATSSPFDHISLATAILFAFIGGMILNLMPCVFPVLSMKALSLVHLKDKDNAIARRHGMAYTAGILVSFMIVAGALLAFKATGAQIGWGFQLQSPLVILFLTYLFFTLGLNLAGYFDVNVSLAHAGDSLARQHGVKGSFFTGVLATLVATPCTAPFMAGALGYALTQPSYIALFIFLFLGLGLAMPYLILTFVPATRHKLPKPGLWMEQFRQFLSFPMFLAACWLLWVLSQQINHMGQFAAILGMVAITFGIWCYKTRPKQTLSKAFFVTASLLSLVFVLATFFIIHPDGQTTALHKTVSQSPNWEDYSRVTLDEYLKGDEPVFVNMTAAWCITCKVNDKVAIDTESTRALFIKNGIKYLKGDWTNQNPEITLYLEEFGRSGVPIYVYYPRRDNDTGTRPQPVILPQILTPAIVEDTIKPEKDI